MKRETFVLHTDLYDKTISLTREEFGDLMRKVFLYVKNDNMPKCGDKVETAFEFVKVDIDKDLYKYQETCKKRQEAIKKRWGNEDYENDTKNTNVYKSINSIQNDYDNDNHIHNHNHNNRKVNKKSMREEEEEKDFKKEFEELWSIYPNKKGKTVAMQKYSLARKQGATYEEVRQGLEHYIKYCETIDQKFIKHGSTWFNQKGWMDEYAETCNTPEWFNKNVEKEQITKEEQEEIDKLLNGLNE